MNAKLSDVGTQQYMDRQQVRFRCPECERARTLKLGRVRARRVIHCAGCGNEFRLAAGLVNAIQDVLRKELIELWESASLGRHTLH